MVRKLSRSRAKRKERERMGEERWRNLLRFLLNYRMRSTKFIEKVVATLKDYCDDFKAHLIPT